MFDVAVIGAGITGSAIAYELSKYNLKIALIEKASDVSQGATKANSAIIHAGFDPKPGTLMAKLNVRGSILTKEICQKLDVPYEQCGALVVAFDDNDLNTVKTLVEQGKENGVEGIRLISPDEAFEMEPHLSREIKGALYAPTSAIVLPWELCFALAETAVKNDVELFLDSEVKNIKKTENGWDVFAGEKEFKAKYVINASGLGSEKIHDMVAEHEFSITPAAGQYFLLDKAEGFRAKHTLFQCPSKVGKGVLVSPTVHGNLIVGPDSKEVVGNDTSTTQESLDFIMQTARKTMPDVDFSQNIRNFAGVRARTGISDFIIKEVEGAKGFIDAAGICSPGLSSAPAIAEYVVELLEKSGLRLEKKSNFIDERKRIKFRKLSVEEKSKLVSEKPEYGHVICRCETITEGEILEAFNSPIPPRSLDAVKRRVGTSMGRCQGGFCSTQIVKILAEQLGTTEDKILMDEKGSWILEK